MPVGFIDLGVTGSGSSRHSCKAGFDFAVQGPCEQSAQPHHRAVSTAPADAAGPHDTDARKCGRDELEPIWPMPLQNERAGVTVRSLVDALQPMLERK
ncbi:hypothetical protein [Azohydromonas australica]|uniref:hypothetical protein n=1 Tax=Azohydromonas australica TaxID=364039 RepID=UPI0005BE1403|nr:hypothetical protein [Azohydromonas australica]